MQHSIFCYIIFALGQFFIRAHIYLEQCLFLSKWNLNNRSWNKACMVLIEKKHGNDYCIAGLYDKVINVFLFKVHRGYFGGFQCHTKKTLVIPLLHVAAQCCCIGSK